LLLALISIFASGSAIAQNNSQTPGKPAAAPAGNADKGKQLYKSYGCYQCHGYEGQGAEATGASRIGPPEIAFAAMVRYIRHPSGRMPPYTEKVASEQDLADIYAFLQTRPKPAAAKSIPLLNQ